jgi:hypothetical protein
MAPRHPGRTQYPWVAEFDDAPLPMGSQQGKMGKRKAGTDHGKGEGDGTDRKHEYKGPALETVHG